MSNISTYFNNSNYKLIVNETIVMLSREGVVFIKLPHEANNWNLALEFTNTDELKELDGTENISPEEIRYTLNKWFSESWVENTVPWNVISRDGRTDLLIKLRTSASKSRAYRQLHISIWKKQI